MFQKHPSKSIFAGGICLTGKSPGGKPNWKNRTLCHGDNLDFLRSINSETVDLIATDPPFNKGRDFHATPDSVAKGASFQDRWLWEEDAHQEWIDKITDDFPKVMNVINGSRESYGDDMGAFLCFMGVRLLEMRRVLKSTGSIYLHCDTTACHYLKELMDSIFHKTNFRNCISWQRNDGRGKGSQHAPSRYGRNTDNILFYTKSNMNILKPYKELTEEEIKSTFPKINGMGRRYKTGIPVFRSKSMGKRPNLCYTWKEFKNPHPSGWRLSKERLEEEYSKGNIIIKGMGEKRKLERRKYVDEYQGKPMDDFWGDIPRIIDNKENTGYPTQKPLALYERIIKASSNKNDMVLDPFCGCATTCVAAEKLNRQWIGIDIWDKAHEIVIERLKKEGHLADAKDKRPELIMTKGDITYTKKLLKRTDDGSEAVPSLKTTLKEFDDTEKDPYSNSQKKQKLLDQYKSICQGCGIKLYERYLELDHQLPRADGGSNRLANRILLCGPCNKLKRHLYTISWLRRENKKRGYMVNENALANLKNQ